MNNSSPKNTLLFVHIITHFKEMIRVARTLKKDKNYNPIVIFITKYSGWEKDYKLCQLEQIKCLTFFEDEVKNWSLLPRLKRKCKNLILKMRFNIKKHYSLLAFKLFNKINRNLKNIVFFSFNILIILFILISILLKHKRIKKLVSILSKISQVISSAIKKMKAYFMHSLVFIFKRFKPSFWSYILVKSYNLLWKNTPQVFSGLSKIAHNFYHSFPKILRDHQIQLIVFPEHNLFYFTQLAVFLAKKQGIPCVIVPYTIANTIEWSEAFHDIPARNLNNKLNKIFAFAFPHWVHVYKEKPLFLPVEVVLIHEMFGITPNNPWLLNSGAIDFIASESKAMEEYYIAAGIEPKLLRTTGALYNDELYMRLSNKEQNIKKVHASLKLTEIKPLILCALPPDQFFGRKDCTEFSDYKNAIEFLIKELVQFADDYHIIINLHPRILPQSVEFLKDYPIKIFYGDIAEIIPLSFLYVATCSATIRMANSCGIPVINYDLYRYHYDDYDHLEGVLTVFDKEEFSSTLKNCASDKNFYDLICHRQKGQSADWGVLDGKAGSNLIKEFDLLFSSEA